MKKSYAIWRWMLLPLFLLSASALFLLFSNYTHLDREPLYLTPIFTDTKGWEIYTLKEKIRTEYSPRELLKVKPGETFYLSRVLTEDLAAEGYTRLRLSSDRPCSVFLDGALLYTTCPASRQSIGEISFPSDYEGLPQGAESVCLTLPREFVGKTLTIATTHIASEYGPSMPSVLFSSRAIEAETLMFVANQNAMPAAAFMVVALFLLGLLFYRFFQGVKDWSLLLLTLAAFAQIFYYLRQYQFSSPASTALDTPFAAFLPHLMVILPIMFLTIQMKQWKKVCMVFVLIPAIVSMFPPAANLIGISVFHLDIFLKMLYISLFALFVFAILEMRDGNQVFRIFLVGLGGICVCCLIMNILSYRSISDFIAVVLAAMPAQEPSLVLFWSGTVFFMLSAGISIYIVIRSTAETQTALAIQTERSARLDYELFIQKQIYKTKLADEEEVRSLRHDMKGHLATLSVLLSEGKFQDASVYLESLTQQHQERQIERFCGDPYMNAVLGTFAARFHENEIPFICHVGMNEQARSGMELCLILNNALENALEASLLQPKHERNVKLQARVRNDQFLLRISNRFDGVIKEQGGLPVTSKKETGHGYGMANIRSTAWRLGGDMYYWVDQGYFILDVHFPT